VTQDFLLASCPFCCPTETV